MYTDYPHNVLSGLLALAALSLAAACAPMDAHDTEPSQPVSGTRAANAFLQLAERHAAIILKTAPEWATQLGVPATVGGADYNARLSDYSPEGNDGLYALNARLLGELNAVERSALTGTAAVTYDVMRNAYELAARQNAHRVGVASLLSAGPPYVVNQLFSPHTDLPRLLIAQQSVSNAEEVAAYVTRLGEVDTVLNDLSRMTTEQARRGVVPPHFALEAIAQSARSFVAAPVTDNAILSSFTQKLEDIAMLSPAERARARASAQQILRDEVYPAYQAFARSMDDLQPLAGTDAGIWRVPGGDALYQIALDAYGANGLSPDTIHQMGLDDVNRIHKQMHAILNDVGIEQGPVGERIAAVAALPNARAANTDAAKQALIEQLGGYVNHVQKIAPQWFGVLPPQPVEVRRIPLYEQDASAGAYYTGPSLDGARPGIFWINLKDTADWPLYTLKSLVYHEAVPGHHFQIGLQQNVTDMPLIRNMMFFSDYGEGWALYAEQLAVEMGLYKNDPLGDLGRLRAEVYRAARLVVDTGLHYKRWSAQKAIDWMVAATGENPPAIKREIERYAVWPGQATSYKLGMIRMQMLRDRAQQTLGEVFDLRRFHDAVLLSGSVPMPVLEGLINQWIEDEQRTSVAGTQ